MMKHILTLALLIYVTIGSFANSHMEQTVVDDLDRIYFVYTPTGYQKGDKERPVMVLLHSTGYSAMTFAELCRVQDISDRNDAIVVLPEALDEDDDEVIDAMATLKKYNLLPSGLKDKYVWGAGARIYIEDLKKSAGSFASSLINSQMPNAVKRGYIELCEDKDDVKFINTLLDEMKSKYNINDNIYVAGASIGGVMAYKYAYSEGCKAKKVGVINGFVGKALDDTKPLNMPLCVFQSLSDELIPYSGGLFTDSLQVILNNIPIRNLCTSAEVTETYQDINTLITIQKIEYGCGDNPTWCYAISNVSHFTILSSDKYDIGYMDELEKFFFQLPTKTSGETLVTDNQSLLYPTSASENLYCEVAGEYWVTNLLGSVVLSGSNENKIIDITSLSAGEYIFSIKTTDAIYKSIFIKK